MNEETRDAIDSLLSHWLASAAAYDQQSSSLSRRGNLYAATRAEGMADGVRECGEELAALLGVGK